MKLTQEQIMHMLPVIISDLKHQDTPEKRVVSDKNIKRELYQQVIRNLYNKGTFLSNDKLPEGGVGCFIKGYVRDVWAYLDEAYDLIHNQSFVGYYTLDNGNRIGVLR